MPYLMRLKLLIVALLLAAGPVSAQGLISGGWNGTPEAPADSGLAALLDQPEADCELACPHWYLRGEALFLHRSPARRVVFTVNDLGTVDDPTDDVPLMTSQDLDFPGYEAGYQVAIGRAVFPGLIVEGSFFNVSEWDADDFVLSTGELTQSPVADALSPPEPPNFLVFPVDDFFQALFHEVRYQSELRGAEMNLRAVWKRHIFGRGEIIGFRWMQLEEDFRMQTIDDRLSTGQDGIGVYDIHTNNNLVGGQYGQEISMPLFGALTVGGVIKSGLYWNRAEQHSLIINNGAAVVDVESESDRLAFVGEVRLNLDVQVNQYVQVRGGYNVMWVEGVALAPEQFTFVPGLQGQINDNGGVFYHGFHIGVEASR